MIDAQLKNEQNLILWRNQILLCPDQIQPDKRKSEYQLHLALHIKQSSKQKLGKELSS